MSDDLIALTVLKARSKKLKGLGVKERMKKTLQVNPLLMIYDDKILVYFNVKWTKITMNSKWKKKD